MTLWPDISILGRVSLYVMTERGGSVSKVLLYVAVINLLPLSSKSILQYIFLYRVYLAKFSG